MLWTGSMNCSVPKKPVKKIMISKKTGMPIVEEEKPEVEEDVELTPVCNSGEKRNKKETAEEKRLRKQKVKEEKSVGDGNGVLGV